MCIRIPWEEPSKTKGYFQRIVSFPFPFPEGPAAFAQVSHQASPSFSQSRAASSDTFVDQSSSFVVGHPRRMELTRGYVLRERDIMKRSVWGEETR